MAMVRIGHFLRYELLSLPSLSLSQSLSLARALYCGDIFLCWPAVTASSSHARNSTRSLVPVCVWESVGKQEIMRRTAAAALVVFVFVGAAAAFAPVGY